MPAPRLEDQIARLYQLPLSDFTAERNLLAKQAGSRAAEVRALQKPPVAAWAVNQLYWRQREVYERLIGAAADLRKAHVAVLGGSRGDVRAAGQSHEEAIDAAIKATMALLRESGQPATDATRQAVATTLRALPGTDPAGLLTRTLQPGGFEMLAGLPVKGRAPGSAPSAAPAAPVRAAAGAAPADRPDAAARERARQAAADAERAVRLAEHASKREEFEAARTARDAEKAAKAVTAAQTVLQEAETALADAERQAGEAAEARAAAETRARESAADLQRARAHLETLRRSS